MQIAVILHDVASHLFLLRSAPMRIEPLVLLDVVTREDDGVPSARVLGAPLLESETVHAEGDLLGREGALHRAAVLVGGVKNSHHILGCAADIIAGNRADHRKLFRLIVKMQQEGRIKFTQLIWEGNGRWIHISYVPGDLRCQVIE